MNQIIQKKMLNIIYINIVMVILVNILNIFKEKSILYGNIMLLIVILFLLYSIKSNNVKNGYKSIKKLSTIINILLIINIIAMIIIIILLTNGMLMFFSIILSFIYLFYAVYTIFNNNKFKGD